MRFIALILLFFSSLMSFDIASVNELYEVAKSIRGNNCDFNSENFEEQFNLILNDPRTYSQNLPKKEIFEQMINENKDYLQYWSVQSISNHLLYEKFNTLYLQSLQDLIKYYETKFNYKTDESIYFASHFVNEILNFACGNYRQALKLSMLERKLTNKNFDKENFLNELSMAEKVDLNLMLNIATLYSRDFELLEKLIKMGAQVNTGDESVLFFALRNHEVMEFLLKNGADVNYANSFGKTILFYAVEFNDLKLVKKIVQNNIDINKKYMDFNEKNIISSGFKNIPFYQNLCGLEHTKRNILMHAAMHSGVDILKVFVDLKIDLHEVDELGYNALDYAILANKTDNINYLKSLGLKQRQEQ